jgi:hypothetical protein
MGDKPSLPPTHEQHPIDGTYQFAIGDRIAGTGDLRLTEYFNAMADLARKFSDPATGASATEQFEIAFYAVNATREFLHRALPGTDIEAPLHHLMMAMISIAEGKRPPMFSVPSTGNGRDRPRILLEAKVSACIDILREDPPGMRVEEAARFVAKILIRAGFNFYRRDNVPAHDQIIEWRKRIRKAHGTWERDLYCRDLARMRAAKVPDPESAVARMLEGFLAGTVSAAHFNKATTDPEE